MIVKTTTRVTDPGRRTLLEAGSVISTFLPFVEVGVAAQMIMGMLLRTGPLIAAARLLA
jgi:hypothetical protein